MGTGDLCRVPPSSGPPRENQAKFRDGTMLVLVQVRDLVHVVGIVAPFAPRGFGIRGNFVLLRNPGYKNGAGRGRGCHVAKQDLVRVVGIVTQFAPRGSVFGEN